MLLASETFIISVKIKKNGILKYNTSAKLDALNKGHSAVSTSTLALSPFPLF